MTPEEMREAAAARLEVRSKQATQMAIGSEYSIAKTAWSRRAAYLLELVGRLLPFRRLRNGCRLLPEDHPVFVCLGLLRNPC